MATLFNRDPAAAPETQLGGGEADWETLESCDPGVIRFDCPLVYVGLRWVLRALGAGRDTSGC